MKSLSENNKLFSILVEYNQNCVVSKTKGSDGGNHGLVNNNTSSIYFFIRTGVMLNRVSHLEITYDLNYMAKVHYFYSRFFRGSDSQVAIYTWASLVLTI